MTKLEIYEAARQAQGLPSSADLLEAGLYYKLADLFDRYGKGIMPAPVCSARKAKYYAEFDECRQWHEIDRQTNRRMIEIAQILDEAEKRGCEYVAEIRKVFYG